MNHLSILILTAFFNPLLIIVFLLRKLPLSWFFLTRMYIDGLHRPYYAFGLYKAAIEAKALGISRISAFEFGVAGGHGLIILEKLAEQITALTKVDIDVYGFDLAVGLPSPSDYRDVPHIWKKGFYKMDTEALQQKLKPSTTLVLGDVKKTVPLFIKKKISPVGFIAFDLDFYSSTIDAFKLFETLDHNMLPRIFCYFDDVSGSEEEILCEYVGELLAIREFNKKHKKKKLCRIPGLYQKRIVKSLWSDMIYVMHNFTHKQYNDYVYSDRDRQMIL